MSAMISEGQWLEALCIIKDTQLCVSETSPFKYMGDKEKFEPETGWPHLFSIFYINLDSLEEPN